MQDAARRAPRRGRVLTLAAALVVIPACGNGDPTPIERLAAERREQVERVAREAKLGEDVQEFLGDAAEAVAGAFTVTYQQDGKKTTLIQDPPERRVDVVTADSTESLIRRRDAVYSCRRQQGEDWSCKRTEAAGAIDPDLGVFSQERLEATAKMLGAARPEYDFSIARREVAGTQARCLVTTSKLGARAPEELCIAPTGAILRVRSASVSLDATRYRAGVPAGAFDLPAEPR